MPMKFPNLYYQDLMRSILTHPRILLLHPGYIVFMATCCANSGYGYSILYNQPISGCNDLQHETTNLG
jgi:hypothetical protein